LIDCLPGRGPLLINALSTAHGVLCPTRPSLTDLAGLKLFLDTVTQVQEKTNPALEFIGFVPVFVNSRTILHRGNLEGLADGKYRVLSPIGESIRVQEAPAFGQSVITYAPDNPVSLAYRQLGSEVEAWASARKML
jgi:chromosome partitioning protein